MLTVYLCGGINGLSDAQAKDWREELKRLFPDPSLCFLDPMRRDYRGREAENVREIVEGDIRDIAAADFVLVNASRPSWGTALEIGYARAMKKPVLFFGAPDPVSPWLTYHGWNLDTFENAAEYLRTLAVDKGRRS